MTDDYSIFSNKLKEWHMKEGRHNLPWQKKGAYAAWVSEVMLQQTQVAVVVPYYKRFMQSFPTLEKLAEASEDSVLKHWAGLGYYSRARNLHSTAKQICQHHNGQIPNRYDQLITLKGIGRSTAGAILSLGHERFGVILDGNVRRVISRFFAIEGNLRTSAKQRQIWDLATQLTPKYGRDAAKYCQAIMDLGALVCSRTKPNCSCCPLSEDCEAYRLSLVDQIPQSKPTGAKREERWLVLELINFEGKSYFEKRPVTGIWGGLYTPPIGSNLTDLAQRYAIEYIFKAEQKTELKHAFSHFSVTLEHHQLRTHHLGNLKNGRWADVKTFDKGLPAPVSTLLNLSRE